MISRTSCLALLAAALLTGAAGCPPESGDRLVLAGPASPAAQALLGQPLGAGRNALPTVLAQVNGAALPFVLDTGSGPTLLRPEAAAALDLLVDPDRATPITGVGGTTRYPNALLRLFQIGRRAFPNLSVPVAPGGEDGGRLAGIIGADLLRHGALEIDLPASRIALYDSPACIAAPPPWPNPGEGIPLEITAEGLPILTLRLNDRPARALLDTGAMSTVLAQDRIAAFGVPASALRTPPAGTVYGTGGKEASFHIHDGARLQFGSGPATAHPIILAPLPASLPVDMVVGQDLLAPRRLWLSYAARRLWLAPGRG
ncbi:retroviral-like aspartic protease family protein [Roseomonas sp. WA12]